MHQLLLASPLIQYELGNLQTRCEALKKFGIKPFLKVVLVGDDPASQVYTKNKKKFCEQVGAQCEIVKLPAKISERDFLQEVEKISIDPLVHGMIIQLPLPGHLRHLPLEELIPVHKDVDGFHLQNLGALMKGSSSKEYFVPCTPKGIMELLKFYKIETAGKRAVIVGRSLIVGKPLNLLLTQADATVTLCHSQTPHLAQITRRAEIIVMAIGKPNYLHREHLSPDIKPIIIDVGINRHNGKLCGDVDFEDVKNLVQAITPVPGGVGPLTVLSLVQNLLQAAENSLT